MFIPIGDDNSRRRHAPIITWILVAANAYVWYLELIRGEKFIGSYAAIPLELSTGIDITTTQFIRVHGERMAIPQGPGPQPIYLTLLKSMFMHGSCMHIIGNMVYLIIFGDQIEDRFGRLRFLLFYLFAGLAAGLAQVIAAPSSIVPCVGASGAIAGVLGAYLILFPRNAIRVLLFRTIILMPAFLVLGLWVLMQFAGHYGAPREEAGVAYMAHLGGLAVGVVVGMAARLCGSGERVRG